MTLVDGTAPPVPPEKSRCQVVDTRPDLGLFGALGLLLVGVTRRRTRTRHRHLECS